MAAARAFLVFIDEYFATDAASTDIDTLAAPPPTAGLPDSARAHR